LNRGGKQAVKATSFMKVPFWGCPMLNFRADLPFHVMRPAYAAFEKEIPMALQSTVGFFKELKCYIMAFHGRKKWIIRLRGN
jgi:hypothetical protein